MTLPPLMQTSSCRDWLVCEDRLPARPLSRTAIKSGPDPELTVSIQRSIPVRELSKAQRPVRIPKVLRGKRGPKGRSVLEVAREWRGLLESDDARGREELALKLKIPAKRIKYVLAVLSAPTELREGMEQTEACGYTITEAIWTDLRRMSTRDAVEHLARIRERSEHRW